MKYTKARLRICVTLLVLVLLFIWGNSCLPAPVSAAFSRWVRNLLAPLFGWPPSVPGTTGPSVLRKVAHLTEFCWLGLCLGWLFGMVRTKKTEIYLYSLLAGIAAACIDETIQIFVPGRGPGIADVGIDTLGVTLGIVFISLIQQIKKNKSKHLEENKL